MAMCLKKSYPRSKGLKRLTSRFRVSNNLNGRIEVLGGYGEQAILLEAEVKVILIVKTKQSEVVLAEVDTGP
jgi:hypothetical protein